MLNNVEGVCQTNIHFGEKDNIGCLWKSGEEPTIETSGTFQKFSVAFQWFLEHYIYIFYNSEL